MNTLDIDVSKYKDDPAFLGLVKTMELSNPRFASLSEDHKHLASVLFLENKTDLIGNLWRLVQKRPIPTIREFLSEEYIGNHPIVDQNNTWHNVILDMYKPESQVLEHILTGAIGTAKSSTAIISHFYNLYRINSLRNPQLALGSAPSKPMNLLLIAPILGKAISTILDGFTTLLRSCKYYREVLKLEEILLYQHDAVVPWCRKGSVIHFPNNVRITIGSNSTHAIGEDLFGVHFDEAEFRGGSVDEVFELYANVVERVRSRFYGQRYTMITFVSSIASETGVMSTYIKNKPVNDPYSKISSYSIWDIKAPNAIKEDGYFYVMRGTKTHPSRMLTDDELVLADKKEYHLPPGCELIKAPKRYELDFKTNVERALRNLAGKATIGDERPFDDLRNIKDENLVPVITLQAPLRGGKPLRNQLPQELYVSTPDGLRLHRFPTSKRYMHLDLADTGEAGIAMVHKEYSKERNSVMYIVDLAIRIVSPNRISFESVNEFLLDLQRVFHINLELITADQYQSTSTLQLLENSKVARKIKRLSVDRTLDPYSTWSNLVSEGVFKVGDPGLLQKQMEDIFFDKNKPWARGRKDIADATCLRGDTKLTLLDGSRPTIKELYERQASDFELISIDLDTRKVTVGLGLGVKRSVRSKSLVRITLDDTSYLECTEDHLIMMRDGSYKQASKLCEGDSLMPLYMFKSKTHKDYYWKYKCPFYKKEEFIYRMVSREVKQSEVSDSWKRTSYDGSNFAVTHHKNHIKTDDSSKNLIPLTNKEHRKLHGDIFTNYNKSSARREQLKQSWVNGTNPIQKWRDSNSQEYIESCKINGKRNITKYNESEEHRSVASRIGKSTIKIAQVSANTKTAKLKMVNTRNLKRETDLEYKKNYDRATGNTLRVYNVYLKFLRDSELSKSNYSYKEWKLKVYQNNHKVVSVKVVNTVTSEDDYVYDVVMSKYHNFRVDSGIFVHNCGAVFNAATNSADLPVNCYEDYEFLYTSKGAKLIPEGFEKL